MSRRVSAIDIGSNAIRMMVVEILPHEPRVRVLKKFRAALRLGHDVFTQGQIGHDTLESAKATFAHYAQINKELHVSDCRAVATSASREAKNQEQFVKTILQSSGIKIEVIDGLEEGRLIHLAVRKELDLTGKKSMLIDIGGGSVEVSFSKGDHMQSTKSFPMGTVRILENLQKRKLNESHLNVIMGEFLENLSDHIHENAESEPPDFAIGTGGNLECLGDLKLQLLGKSPKTYLSLSDLNIIIDRLRSYKIKERVDILKLRPDRADVIVPAAMLVQTILRQAEVEKLLIPKVGLRDGIIWSMLDKKEFQSTKKRGGT